MIAIVRFDYRTEYSKRNNTFLPYTHRPKS